MARILNLHASRPLASPGLVCHLSPTCLRWVSTWALFTELLGAICMALRRAVSQSHADTVLPHPHAGHRGRVELAGEMGLIPDLYVSIMRLIS